MVRFGRRVASPSLVKGRVQQSFANSPASIQVPLQVGLGDFAIFAWPPRLETVHVAIPDHAHHPALLPVDGAAAVAPELRSADACANVAEARLVLTHLLCFALLRLGCGSPSLASFCFKASSACAALAFPSFSRLAASCFASSFLARFALRSRSFRSTSTAPASASSWSFSLRPASFCASAARAARQAESKPVLLARRCCTRPCAASVRKASLSGRGPEGDLDGPCGTENGQSGILCAPNVGHKVAQNAFKGPRHLTFQNLWNSEVLKSQVPGPSWVKMRSLRPV